MAWQTVPHLILLGLAIIVAATLFIITWHRRQEYYGAVPFALLMFFIVWWSSCHLLEILSAVEQTKLFWSKLQYVGITGVVLMWFLFALAYTGRGRLLNRFWLGVLLIEPVAVQILLWTNEYHYLMYQRIDVLTAGAITTAQSTHGPAFWVHAIYSYILLIIGTAVLVQLLFRHSPLYRKQVLLMLLGLSVPWVANFLYLFNVTANDLTPFGFSVSGITLAWGLLRLQLLGLVPTAYSTIFMSLSDAVIVINAQNQIVDLNPAAEALVRRPLTELLGKSILALFPHQPSLTNQYLYTREAHTELTITTSFDTLIHVDLRISPLLDWQDRFIGRIVVIRDITDQKQIQVSEHEQRILAETLSETAAILNSNLKLSAVLQAILANVERVLPHDAANIMLVENGKARIVGFNGYAAPAPTDEPAQAIDRLAVSQVTTLAIMNATGKYLLIPDVRQFPSWRSSRHTAWIQGYLGAPIQVDGEVIGFINVDNAQANSFNDEHGQRLQAFANQAGIALRNARLFSELEARNEELDAYAYTIAHDLKSPLSVTVGYANMLADYDLPEEARFLAEMVEKAALGMDEMVEQLLLLARLRDTSITAEVVETTAVAIRAVNRFEKQISERAITTHVEAPLHLAIGHQHWVEEVFANLISNAIKYIGADNDAPQITIRSQAQNGMVRYEVSDNGLGISPENQAKLFDMFSRFHKEEAAGTGLGLSIVQRMVTRMKGDLGVVSELGMGSTFWFTLPGGDD